MALYHRELEGQFLILRQAAADVLQTSRLQFMELPPLKQASRDGSVLSSPQPAQPAASPTFKTTANVPRLVSTYSLDCPCAYYANCKSIASCRLHTAILGYTCQNTAWPIAFSTENNQSRHADFIVLILKVIWCNLLCSPLVQDIFISLRLSTWTNMLHSASPPSIFDLARGQYSLYLQYCLVTHHGHSCCET